MYFVYIVELHVTVHYIKYLVLHKNALMANLCRRQQQNLHKSTCQVPDAASNKKVFLNFLRN
jgi:hypothetical protein